MAAKQATTYCNPFWHTNFPDPFVLKVRGRYYAYSTEPKTYPASEDWIFPILTSTDMVQWREVGKAMPGLGGPYGRYWAPEVTVYNGQFLLYYAVHTEEFTGGIRVAVADRPEGPFRDSGYDLTGHFLPWAIDPHVFRDQDGQWYLYITVEYWNDPGGYIGSGNIVDRLVNPFTLEGHATRVTPPQHEWQLFEAKRQARGGVDWYTVEGPAVIRHREQYYETFSGGCYYRDNYAVSYATSKTPMGPNGMHDTSWHDWEGTEGSTILIHGDREHVLSPGHNSLVLGPNNADQYIAYHASLPGRIERLPYLDRLFWHGEELWTPAPTYTPQPAPAMPRFRELFEEPVLQDCWQQQEGQWSVSDGAAVQEDANECARLHCQENLSSAWLLEVNLRHHAARGSYGIVLESDTGRALRIFMTSEARLEVCSSDSPDEPIQTMALPDDLVVQAWHQLIISRSGSLLSVQLDYFHPLEVVVEYPLRTFSLFTEQCSAAFSGISLTDLFRDEFLNEQQTPVLLGWHGEASAQGELQDTALADWHVQDGRLKQTQASAEHMVLKGPFHEQYEFGVTMMLDQINEHGQPAFGLVLWQRPEEKLLVWFVRDSSHWILSVEHRVQASEASPTTTRLDLPHSFDPFHWHTLRLRRWGGRLMVYLNGPEVLTLSMPARPERSGLITRDATAAFLEVWQTGLRGD